MSDLEHIPEGYFEGLHDRIKNSIENLEENLEKDAPTLTRIGKDLGYVLPEKYFEELTFNPIKDEKNPRERTLWRWASIAAALIFPVMAILIFNDNKTEGIVYDQDLEEESLNELVDYYIQAEDFSTADLSFFDEETFEESTLFGELTNEELETYLDNIIDEFSIYELDEI